MDSRKKDSRIIPSHKRVTPIVPRHRIVSSITAQDVDKLDAVIHRKFPELTPQEIQIARSRLLKFIADGMEENAEVGVVKPEGPSDFKVRVFRMSRK